MRWMSRFLWIALLTGCHSTVNSHNNISNRDNIERNLSDLYKDAICERKTQTGGSFNAIDALIIVDASASFHQEAVEGIADGLATLVETLQERDDLDFQLAFIPNALNHSNARFEGSGIVTRDTPIEEITDNFLSALVTRGDGREFHYESLRAAIAHAQPGGPHDGFFRDGAATHVVHILDEDDNVFEVDRFGIPEFRSVDYDFLPIDEPPDVPSFSFYFETFDQELGGKDHWRFDYVTYTGPGDHCFAQEGHERPAHHMRAFNEANAARGGVIGSWHGLCSADWERILTNLIETGQEIPANLCFPFARLDEIELFTFAVFLEDGTQVDEADYDFDPETSQLCIREHSVLSIPDTSFDLCGLPLGAGEE